MDQADAPLIPVALQGAGSQDFRKASGGGGGLELHLPKAVLCRDVSLRKKKVPVVLCEEMRHATVIVHDRYRLEQSLKRQSSVCRRVSRFGILPETVEGTQEFPRRRKPAHFRVQNKNDDHGNAGRSDEFD